MKATVNAERFEKTLEGLFDFQRFAGNAALQSVIDDVDSRYGEGKLSIEELGMLNAAGDPSVFWEKWGESGFQ